MCDENHHTQITYVLTALLMDFQGIAVKKYLQITYKRSIAFFSWRRFLWVYVPSVISCVAWPNIFLIDKKSIDKLPKIVYHK